MTPFAIQWPSTQVTTTLTSILTAVGRDFKINIKTTGIPCTSCLASGYFDPVTNSSTNSFCNICFGEYYTNTISGVTLNGHIRWLNSEIPRKYPGGNIPDGDCLITVLFSSGIRNYIENAHNFEVDGRKLSLKGYALRGASHPNRIVFTMKEESN